jgi:hypothetical protein
VILVGEDADTYTDLAGSICETVAERRPVSKQAIKGLVDDFFMRALPNGDHTTNPNLGDQLSREADELKTALFDKPQDWEARLVVEGLAPSGLPCRVGNVQFQHLDDAGLAGLKEHVSVLIKNLQPRDVDSALTTMSNNLEVWRGKTIAVLSINAVDGEAAIQAAKRKLQITVDAINLFSPRESMGGWVFLPGDTMPQREFVLATCENSITPVFRSAGPRRKIPLSQISQRKGFARVSELLGKESPIDLEDRILASVQWAGRAQVEARPEEAFLLYAIALESLLLGRDVKTELTYRLAVRCAHIVGGPTLEDKKRVIDQIQSLYQLRSRIVHSGSFVVGEPQLALIRDYALLTVLLVVDRAPFDSMRTVKEFETWLENQVLSGGLSTP